MAAKKTGVMRSPKNGVEVPTGAHPKNTGGKKGRSGRPPALFTQFARELYDDPKVRAEIKAVLKNRKEKHFASTHKTMLPFVAPTKDGAALADAVRSQCLTVRFVKPAT